MSPTNPASSAVRYDLDAHSVAGTSFGVSYIDDCFIIGMSYITNYIYSGNVNKDHRVMLQMSLRTLGGTQFGSSVNSVVGGL